MKNLALGLAASMAVSGCAQEIDHTYKYKTYKKPQPARTARSVKDLLRSRAALAVYALKTEANGIEKRAKSQKFCNVQDARLFREAKVVDANPFPQVEIGGGIFSVIANARTGIFTLYLEDGHLTFDVQDCYAFDGNPDTPIVNGYIDGADCMDDKI